jgi:hypothetical protein
VDADPNTPEIEPFDIPYSFAHSGLQGPWTSYGVFVVTATVSQGDVDKPEAGSGIVVKTNPGEALPPAAVLPDSGFLGFASGSSYGDPLDPANRWLYVDEVDGAAFHRAIFKASGNRRWLLWLPPGTTKIEIPNPESVFPPAEGEQPAFADRAGQWKDLIVNAFTTRDGETYQGLAAFDGSDLNELLLKVDTYSYYTVDN